MSIVAYRSTAEEVRRFVTLAEAENGFFVEYLEEAFGLSDILIFRESDIPEEVADEIIEEYFIGLPNVLFLGYSLTYSEANPKDSEGVVLCKEKRSEQSLFIFRNSEKEKLVKNFGFEIFDYSEE
jgi:hypothetical protein